MTVPKYKRVVLKLSGEALAGGQGFGIDQHTVQNIARQISEIVKLGVQVAVRNVRREANDELKAQEKAGGISEDEVRRGQDEVQKLTDKYIKEIDKLAEHKEEEIMEL